MTKRTCWDILGLAEAWLKHLNGTLILSEKEIKKAYYKMARTTHPDKVKGRDAQKTATARFRQVHTAYEEATKLFDHIGSGSCERGQSEKSFSNDDDGGPAMYSDEYMRKAFDVISKELDEEEKERTAASTRAAFLRVLEAWPDEERAWNAFLNSNEDRIRLYLRLPKCICEFLDQRAFIYKVESNFQQKVHERELIAFIQRHQHKGEAWLVDEIMKDPTRLSNASRFVKVVSDPMVKRILRTCADMEAKKKKEFTDGRLRLIARRVEHAYPSIPAMKKEMEGAWCYKHLDRLLEMLLARVQEPPPDKLASITNGTPHIDNSRVRCE